MVAVAVTVACRDVGAPALVDVAWAIAHAASIRCSHTIVYIVANAIAVSIVCSDCPIGVTGLAKTVGYGARAVVDVRPVAGAVCLLGDALRP